MANESRDARTEVAHFEELPEDEARAQAVAIARSMLFGDPKTGLIEGCIALNALGVEAVADANTDEDFIVFKGVSSETDALPIGSVRQYWSAAALAREDKHIAEYENAIRDVVLNACRNVIARFGRVH